ncbi:hypothetical protein [Athalassotoga saccharophila]|uniref:hypothetical protein n=1 Tax=Athalassotoga saccharophila TaxID=1441386 RepID=UPI00137AEB33|nr:hypothetical protein [Athalassotoga saccharophila]BBJ28442.1 hypothetical protein ATHSA_1355 [Athalassotoga saccharophila]
MDFLEGFTDVFERIKKNPLILAPVFGVLLITLIFNLILYGLRSDEFNGLILIMMVSFIFGVIEWALAILAVSIMTSIMMGEKRLWKEELRVFFNFFAFSIFMSFFLMIGFEINVILGLVMLLLILYVPNWFVASNACDLYGGFKWNLSFIFRGIRSAYAFIIIIVTALLTLVPYAGNYLAIFFYVVWTANTYIHIMENQK